MTVLKLFFILICLTVTYVNHVVGLDCATVRCLKPNCKQPVYSPNWCCPRCPAGTSCVFGSRIVPDGKTVKVECYESTCRSGTMICPQLFAPCSKPGTCPKNDDISTCVITENNCFGDYECPGNKKCCPKGCGRECVNPEK